MLDNILNEFIDLWYCMYRNIFFFLIEFDLSMYFGMFREILVVVFWCDVVFIVYLLVLCVYLRKLDRFM